MSITNWIYPKALLKGMRIEDYNAFLYYVCFEELDYHYIGYKSIRYRTGRPSSWETYKTSSKLVKQLIKEGNKPDFYILSFYEDVEDAVKEENRLLNEWGCVWKKSFLNQSSGTSYMLHKETYNDEWRALISQSLKDYYKENDHPLQGKVHPNKGKLLPQTAPKVHVSLNKHQVTDGEVNLWVDKGFIPEGFRKGITCKGKRKPRSAEDIEKATISRSKNHRDKYNKSPKMCLFCSEPLVYEDRTLTTHRGECASKYRSKLSSIQKSIPDETKRRVRDIKRLRLAEDRGFKTYGDLVKSVMSNKEKGLTYRQLSSKFNLAISTIVNMKNEFP